MKKLVIYPGRFHPFHKGHKSVYDTLVKQFGNGNVYVATSDKVEPPKSPFTYAEKVEMMKHAGVPVNAIMLTKQPYRPVELLDGEDADTIVMFAVSEKDMDEDPRFAFKPKQDGSPSYFQPAGGDMKGWETHGYIITVPTLEFKVLGQPMTGATDFRRDFSKADEETQKEMITDLYGSYDEKIHKIMSSKITESYYKKLTSIMESVTELSRSNAINNEQKSKILTKLNRIYVEMQIHSKRKMMESLYSIDKEDIMNSEVLVQGVGRYSVKGLMQNISAKLDDLSKEASEMTPYNYKNIKAKIDSGILTTMLNSLTDAFNDLEKTRRKGGANSRAIPANLFDDVMLQELQITQGTALKVLANVALRKDSQPFPIRMKDGEIVPVSPKLAQTIIDLYDGSGSVTQKKIEKLLGSIEGFKQLIDVAKKKNRTL